MQFPFSAIKRLGTGLIAASLGAIPVFAADIAIGFGHIRIAPLRVVG